MSVNTFMNMTKIAKTVTTATSVINPAGLVVNVAINIGLTVVTNLASKKIVKCIESKKK